MLKVMPWPCLAFSLQTDMNQTLKMKYCTLFKVKRLQKYERSKLEVEKICQITRALGASVSNLTESAISYQSPTLTYDIFAV